MGLFVHCYTLIVFVKKLAVKSFLTTVCYTGSFDVRTARDVYHGWCIFSTFVSILARFFVPTELKGAVLGNLSIVIACVVVVSFSFKPSDYITKDEWGHWALGVSFLPLGSKETQTTATQDTAVVTATKLIET